MLGFGLGLTNCGIVGGVADAPDLGSGASALLAGEADGLALDFTDFSARVKDTGTPANNYNSSGQVSSGALVGCSGLLTYTSPSNKMTRQADGYYKYQAHNLATYSEQFDNAAWMKSNCTISANAATAPDGTLTADALIPNSGSFSADQYQSVATIVGGSYYWSICVKNGGLSGADWVEITTAGGATTRTWFNLVTGVKGSGNGTIEDIGNGWYRCSVPKTAAATSTLCYISPRGSNGSVAAITGDGVTPAFYEWGAHVYRYPANTDYIKTTSAAKYALPLEYDTSGTCLGLLVEEARTNLVPYAVNLSGGSWVNARSTDAQNVTTSPSGLSDANSLTEDGTAGNTHQIQYAQVPASGSAAAYTFSGYFKANTRSFVALRMQIDVTGTPQNHSAYFNLSTGTYVGGLGTTPDGYGIEDTGNGWYRCWVTGTNNASGRVDVLLALGDSASPGLSVNVPIYNGDGSSGIYVWGLQNELGAFPTSPILTHGATATRAADQISQLTSTFPLSATAGSFYAYVTPYAGADLAGLVSLNDGSGDEEIVIYKDASANIVAQVEDGGVGQLAPLDSTVNSSSGTAFKVALAWAANDFALSANGTAAQTDTGGTLPTVTTFEIGVDQANNYFNGHIRAISYVPRRKSDAELATETA